VRIIRITLGSSMVASTRMRPPHRRQDNTSTVNMWRNTSGDDHPRGAGGGRVVHSHSAGRVPTRRLRNVPAR
jgi:hypothetical protein